MLLWQKKLPLMKIQTKAHVLHNYRDQFLKYTVYCDIATFKHFLLSVMNIALLFCYLLTIYQNSRICIHMQTENSRSKMGKYGMYGGEESVIFLMTIFKTP